MKILLDPQIFEQKFGGISRLFTEEFRLLIKYPGVTIHCPVLFTENLHLKHYNLAPRFLPFLLGIRGVKRFITKQDLYQKNKQRVRELLRGKKYDLFIPTYYDTYFLDTIGNTPFVLTVYDMIHELFPVYFVNDRKTVDNKKILMEKAVKIIAISQSTKNDILKIYPHIPAEKVEVVYLHHSIDYTQKNNVAYLPKGKYVLFVGNRGAYKNFNWFIKAAGRWLIEHQIKLVCIGGQSFNPEENELIVSLNLSELVHQYNFKDSELASFYANAGAFVFPSEYEGFGIPVLESMACNCPVILPPVSSFPEVAGEAGVYFELNNQQSLIEAMDKTFFDENFRNGIIAAGRAQVSKFSWEKTVSECLNIYKSAVQ